MRLTKLYIPEGDSMPIVSVASFAELAKTVEQCLEEAEGGKHRAYHLIMEFHKRGVEVFVRAPQSIFESSSDLGHGD